MERMCSSMVSSLGSDTTDYVTSYCPSLLESVKRTDQRCKLGLKDEQLPFEGYDVWNAYEFTWLNSRGKPEVALVQLKIPVTSTNIVESKSLKLYFCSFSNTSFQDQVKVIETLKVDLSEAFGESVSVTLKNPDQIFREGINIQGGESIDDLDIDISEYHIRPEYLDMEAEVSGAEMLYSDLFMSLCPITGQPDYATVFVNYSGPLISHRGLLCYLVSYREHADFAEQICERIFMDLIERCNPEALSVGLQFGRRGGIDINAYRMRGIKAPAFVRNWRQ